MSIPKFSNPYTTTLATSTAPCTRAEIFGADNDSDSDGADVDSEAPPSLSGSAALAHPPVGHERDGRYRDAVKWLEDYLRSGLIYEIHGGANDESTGVGKESRKRSMKRRRDLESGEGPTTEVNNEQTSSLYGFRLLSTDNSPRMINVQPKPPKFIKAIERECEDSAERAEERMQQARMIAVDFDWVIRQSQARRIRNNNLDKKLRSFISSPDVSTASAASSNQVLYPAPSNILVTEYVPKPLRVTQRVVRAASRPRPSPHELKGKLCCPLLPVQKLGTEDSENRRRKKRMRGATPSKRKCAS